MTTYSITISQTEDMALAYSALSQSDWVDHMVRNRCRIAIDEIVGVAVQKCLENNIQIPASKELIIELAFASGWVKTAEQRQAEHEAEQAAMEAAMTAAQQAQE